MTNQNSSTNKPQDVQQTAPIDTQANILFEAGLPARYLPTSPAASSRAIGLPLIIAIVAIGAIAAILISGIISARLLAQQSTPAAVAMLPTFTLTVTDTETDSSSFLKSTSIPLPVTQNAAAAANSTAIVTANAVPTTAIPTVQPTTAEAAVPPTNTPHPSPTDALTNTATATFTSTILPATISTSAATVNAIVAVTQAVTMNATVVTTQAATTSATIARTQAATMSATVGAASPVVIPSTALATASTNSPATLAAATATDDASCAIDATSYLGTLEADKYKSDATASTINFTSTKPIASIMYADTVSNKTADKNEKIRIDVNPSEKASASSTKSPPSKTPEPLSKNTPKPISNNTNSVRIVATFGEAARFLKFSIQLDGCNQPVALYLISAPAVTIEAKSSVQISGASIFPPLAPNAKKITAFCGVAFIPLYHCPTGNLYLIFLVTDTDLQNIQSDAPLPIYYVPFDTSTSKPPDATLQISDASAFKSAIFQQPKDAKGYVLIYAPASLVTQTPTVKP